jgi:hypothetical protein
MMQTDGGLMNKPKPQHHHSRLSADFDQDRALDDVHYRVLLAIPTETYIPIFAIGVETRRSQRETIVLDDREELSRLVGGNLSRNLLSRYRQHRVMQVRIRVSPRTVLYSQWLGFPTLEQADDFARENSRFGLTAIRVRTDAEYTMRKTALESGLTRGRFDLSRIEPRSRLNRAREYIEGAEDLNRLEEGQRALATLEEALSAVADAISVG